MKFSDLQLTQAQRLELLVQSLWSIEEAACYFCDIRAVQLDKLSPDELQVLHETELIYDIEELTAELPKSFSEGEYFRRKYNDPHVTKKSIFPVEEFMLWANEQWPLTHGKQLPRIVLEYNLLKEAENRDHQEIFESSRTNQDSNLPLIVVNQTIPVPEVQEGTPTIEEETKSVIPPDVLEKYKFLRDRGIRIDLWISLCHDCYRLWWNDAPHPIPLPPNTEEDPDKRKERIAKEKATYNSWFKKGEPYASMNKSHVYEVIGGLFSPKNPGGRRPGSKNLQKKRSAEVSCKGKP